MSERKFPETIGVKTRELEPVLRKWREQNPGVNWSYLLNGALRNHPELRRIAGKRHARLMGLDVQEESAA